MTTVTCAYRFALDPTTTQARALLSHPGAARVAHNWALHLIQANINGRGADRKTSGQVP